MAAELELELVSSCAPALKQVLRTGNETGGRNIRVTAGDAIVGEKLALKAFDLTVDVTKDLNQRVGGDVNLISGSTTLVAGNGATKFEADSAAMKLIARTDDAAADVSLRVVVDTGALDVAAATKATLAGNPGLVQIAKEAGGTSTSIFTPGGTYVSYDRQPTLLKEAAPDLDLVTSNTAVSNATGWNQAIITESLRDGDLGGVERYTGTSEMTSGALEYGISRELTQRPGPVGTSQVYLAGQLTDQLKSRLDVAGGQLISIIKQMPDGTPLKTVISRIYQDAIEMSATAETTGSAVVNPDGNSFTGNTSLIGFDIARKEATAKRITPRKELRAAQAPRDEPAVAGPSQVHISADHVLVTGAISETSLYPTAREPTAEYLVSVSSSQAPGAATSNITVTPTSISLSSRQEGVELPGAGISLGADGQISVQGSLRTPAAVVEFVTAGVNAGPSIVVPEWTPRVFNTLQSRNLDVELVLSDDGTYVTFPGQERDFLVSATSSFFNTDLAAAVATALRLYDPEAGSEVLIPGSTIFASGQSVINGLIHVTPSVQVSLVYKTTDANARGLGVAYPDPSVLSVFASIRFF